MALQQSQVEQGRQATGDAVMRPAHPSLIRSKDFAAIGHCHDRCGSRYCLHLLPTCGSVRVVECHLSLFSLRCTISIKRPSRFPEMAFLLLTACREAGMTEYLSLAPDRGCKFRSRFHSISRKLQYVPKPTLTYNNLPSRPFGLLFHIHNRPAVGSGTSAARASLLRPAPPRLFVSTEP